MTHLRLLDAVIDNDIWEVVVTTNPNASGASQASTGHCNRGEGMGIQLVAI